MAGIVKWLRPRIVVPIYMGSNPITRPIFNILQEFIMTRISERIENFLRAFSIYSDAVAEYKKNSTNVLNHMALIQSFEVCFELAWKVLKDYLNSNGINVYLPKEVIKEAFSAEVITDGQIWIDMLNARNSTSHEYNLDKVQTIISSIAGVYFNELMRFSKQVRDFNE